jgi:hypothetical protein
VEAIVAGYVRDYYTIAPTALVDELSADLLVLQQVITADPESHQLRRVVAQLGMIMALALGSADQTRSAQRWWSTARRTADQAGCTETVALVRGKEVVRGLYERRPVPELLAMAAAGKSAGRPTSARPIYS